MKLQDLGVLERMICDTRLHDMKKTESKSSNLERIKIERRGGCFVDANGILKGEWGGFHELESVGPNGEVMFEIYYNRFSKSITINEYGFFYNLFSCKKYDGVLKLYDDLFLCEKNERFGLIDENSKTILHTCFNEIKCVDKIKRLFIISTETGKFLFASKRVFIVDAKTENGRIIQEQRILSEVYDELYSTYYDYFVYEDNGMYGLMNANGEVVLKPQPEYEWRPNYNRDSWNQLYVCFQNSLFGIKVCGDKLYSKIPTNVFDLCFKVGLDAPTHYYITKKGSKYGLLNWKFECVTEPKYDEIIPYKGKYWVEVHRNAYSNAKGEYVDVIFVVCRKKNTFSLYNIQNCKCIIDKCEKIEYVMTDDQLMYIEYIKSGKLNYVSIAGNIINTEEYDDVIKTRYHYLVSKDGKIGALNSEGVSIAPCIYEKIVSNRRGELIVTLDGKEDVLNPIPNIEDDNDYEYERPSYGRHAGSYAQDEAGYSDDDIDTIFDGDPSAYWNID